MAIFDAIATEYDDWYESKMGAFVDKVETDLAFSLFKPTPGMKILDVGCGTGNFSIKLAEMGCQVVGVDLSDKMLGVAMAKVAEKGLNITFHKMDVYQLDFADNSFDAVFSMAAFEFIGEPRRAYNEMLRVLKPGGQLLIGTIHKNSSWGRLYLEHAATGESIFTNAYFKTREELEDLDRQNLMGSGECLFIPPNAPEEDINSTKEEEYSKTERGGYICALWKKPA